MVDKKLLSLIIKTNISFTSTGKRGVLNWKNTQGHKEANYKGKINKWVDVQLYQHHTMSSIFRYQIGKG